MAEIKKTAPQLRSVDVGRLLRIEDPADWGGGLVLHANGIFRREFSGDEQAWRTLSPQERHAIGEPSELLLAIPCSLTQLEKFVISEGLGDGNTARRMNLLRAFFRARGNGVGERPAQDHAPSVGHAAETPAARRKRRLERLRELGGGLRPAGEGWHMTGTRGVLATLVREEEAAGRPMADKTDVRADLAAAMGEHRGS